MDDTKTALIQRDSIAFYLPYDLNITITPFQEHGSIKNVYVIFPNIKGTSNEHDESFIIHSAKRKLHSSAPVFTSPLPLENISLKQKFTVSELNIPYYHNYFYIGILSNDNRLSLSLMDWLICSKHLFSLKGTKTITKQKEYSLSTLTSTDLGQFTDVYWRLFDNKDFLSENTMQGYRWENMSSTHKGLEIKPVNQENIINEVKIIRNIFKDVF